MPTDAASLQAYAALGGVVIALIGLVFVILQLRGLEQSVRIGAHTAMYGQAAEFRAQLVAYPHLRKYFFDGVAIEAGHEDYDRAVTIAELYLNYLEHIAVTLDSFGAKNRAALDGFIRSALAKSPLLKQRLADNPAGYNQMLLGYLR